MKDLRVFNNEEFGQIRTLTVESEPWFVGKDVADILGYSNTRDALSKHIDDEDKSAVAIHDGSQNRNMVIVNESGLYSLILSSKLETAKKFKHWVTSEVLPSIRRTGTYSMQASDRRLEIMDRNSRTRQANLLMKMADVDTLSREYKNVLVSKATEVLTGTQLIPLPKSTQKGYSAKEIGNMFGVTPQRIGKISNANNLKNDKYGQWYHSKSAYSPKEVDTFIYNDNAIEAFRQILGS